MRIQQKKIRPIIHTEYEDELEKGHDSFIRKIRKSAIILLSDIKDKLEEKKRAVDFGIGRKKVKKRNSKKAK